MSTQYKIKPIAITLIVVGFLFGVKLLFPIYQIDSRSMANTFPKGSIVVVSKLHKVGKGDVVLYSNNDKLYISRVIAGAEDEVESQEGVVKVNGGRIDLDSELFEYHMYTEQSINDSLVKGFKELYPKREYKALLTLKEADVLTGEKGVLKVERIVHSASSFSVVLKDDSSKYWNGDNFGPVKVLANSFWVMNDNKANINDSRSFNLIEEEAVVGKLIYIFH